MDKIASNIEKIKLEVDKLVKDGVEILKYELEKADDPSKKDSTSSKYQKWYSVAYLLVQQTLIARVDEFSELYLCKKRRNDDITFLTYGISDYYLGLSVTRGYNKEPVVNPLAAFSSKFQLQITIVKSISATLDTIIANIKGTLQAELFDNEIEECRLLLKNGHLRASGSVLGVIIERHFNQVADNHKIKIAKKNPTISDYNDSFKDVLYDVIQWRFIQRLGDIRNFCSHNKDREPTKDEVQELLDGTDKIIKTIY